ncbi:metal ABC transporter permease [Tissierella sp. MSJ-40]|uniref:Metal ABC transporter permease n=1 Tax=Tissierella simiarum TaxID=2841534 RepID=A0ABS6E2H7_9FIRM|nr:iron chelate uptake ABC transporter family permease subunit [Tissierella simiarum]MBU5437099.1 metal ABC transporter permease [Tissierella simiarum]
MNFLYDILLDHTLITVGLGSAIFGIISGVLGTYAVLRKQSLIGDAVSHAALPGICIIFLITGTKETSLFLIGALISGIIASSVIMYITNVSKIKYDSSLGMVLSVFFGLGLVLLTYIQKIPNANQAGLERFLFGQASTLLKFDVKIMAIVGLLVVFITSLLWKEFKLLCFNSEFGASLGFPIKKLDFLLTGLLVVSIVMGLQTVGVILMSSMIIAPAVAARQWTDKLWLMMILSALFGSISGITGTLISFFVPKMPTGPIIVVVMSAITFISILFAPNRGTIWKIIRDRKNEENINNYVLLAEDRK